MCRKYHIRIMSLLAMAVICLVLQSCTTVQPWEREQLADPYMTGDADPLAANLKTHIYFSKEHANGGDGESGGGCGCN